MSLFGASLVKNVNCNSVNLLGVGKESRYFTQERVAILDSKREKCVAVKLLLKFFFLFLFFFTAQVSINRHPPLFLTTYRMLLAYFTDEICKGANIFSGHCRSLKS